MSNESRTSNAASGLKQRWLAGLLILGAGVAGPAQSAHAAELDPQILEACSTAEDGSVTVTEQTVLNTYFAAAEESTLAAGTRELALRGRTGADVPVRAGDRLLVIQMQGAQINPGTA